MQEYEEFVEKFVPKKTTDDCYTPEEVYNEIKKWVVKEYGLHDAQIVRPFWPGGDYQKVDYPKGSIVIDNPPFSILSQIIDFFVERDIQFFIFAPSLTSFSGKKNIMNTCRILCDATIVYENGAAVKTSFVTNLEKGIVARSSPELTKIINKTVKTMKKEKGKNLPKYIYPLNVLTAAMMQRYARYGIDIKIKKEDCMPISQLDSQKGKHNGIYGGGLLLSSRAAAERAAAEVFTLSEKEIEMIRVLDGV